MDTLKMFTLVPQAVELENGQTVYLKRLTAADRVEYFGLIAGDVKDVEASQLDSLKVSLDQSARLLVMSLCDKDGNRLFLDEQVEAVKGMDALILGTLTDHALRLNALTSESKEDVKKK